MFKENRNVIVILVATTLGLLFAALYQNVGLMVFFGAILAGMILILALTRIIVGRPDSDDRENR